MPQIDGALVAWFSQKVMLPLIPVIFGAILRIMYVGEIGWDIFEETEVCICMSLIVLLALLSASKMSDPKLADALTGLFSIIMILFLVIFSITTWIKLGEYEILDHIKNLSSHGRDAIIQLVESFKPDPRLSRVRTLALIFSVISIVIVTVAQHKYKFDK